MTAPEPAPRQPAIVWDGAGALVGAVYALPALVIAPFDVPLAVAAAVGALPAAMIGMAPQRRRRWATALLGILAGVPVFIGAVVGNVPIVAALTIIGVALGATALAARPRLGSLVLTLCLPMVGIGLSYHRDVGRALGVTLVIMAGSLYAWLVSLAWPDRPPPATPRPTPPPPTLGYGLRLGLAGATAAAIGFALDLGHVGWACAAALLVMRPSAELQRIRSVGRIASVAVGATVGTALVRVGPPDGWYGLAAVLAIAAVGATRASRWYITAGFTTFLVFVLLLYGNLATAQSRFDERVGETALGVAIAYVYGLALPALGTRLARRDRAARRDKPSGPG